MSRKARRLPWENRRQSTSSRRVQRSIRLESLERRELLTMAPIHLSPTDTIDLPEGGEISAYDAASQRLFVTGDQLHIIDASNPEHLVEITTIPLAATSVAANNGVIAVAVPASPMTDPGSVVFLNADGIQIGEVIVGSLPDMLTFTPDGSKVLVANEGEPASGVDPLASISIIDISAGVASASVQTVGFSQFDGREEELRSRGVRIFPGKSVSQDVEPEYIAVDPSGTTAFVTLQEANSFAILDIAGARIRDILPLGLKDHSVGEANLTQYALTDLPELGVTSGGDVIQLGGMSGLWFDGTTDDGQLKFLTVPDRGPNGDPTPAGERPFLLPDYQARVVEFQLNPVTGQVTITNQILLTRPDGSGGSRPITGLPNIAGVDETPVDSDGNCLPYDPFGADLEGIVRAPDGTFWMPDEYRPSIYHFSADGQLIDRFVPVGTAHLAAKTAGAYGTETLPMEYSNRVSNRGFEAIAYDTDLDIVYAFIQSPLANPDQATSNGSDVLRILGIDAQTGVPVAEYLYLLEDPAVRTSKVDKIGDAVYAGDGKFLVVERDSGTTAESKKYVFEIDLKGATNLLDGSRYDPYFLGLIGGKEPATDSASAGTAISTGYKTDDGNLAWLPGDPAGGSLTTIAETLRAEEDFSIGVVSTVPFTHATPAAFVSHNVSRNNYTQIGSEIIHAVQPEVVIGGGNRDWGGNYLSAADQSALEGGSTAYTYVGREPGVDGGNALLTAAWSVDVTAGEKLFGLFGGVGGNFEYHEVSDSPGSPSVDQGNEENPTLAEATIAALGVLGADPDGFFVMLEQGDIDWSNHANDFENMVGGVWDLDQAVLSAQDAVAYGVGGMDWSNTLMIVTSDHSNSYMRTQSVLGAGNLPTQEGDPYAFSYPQGEVSYGTTNHTNELVTLSARGAGSQLFADYAGTWYPGSSIVDNTAIYQVMRRAALELGVEHVILFIGDGMNIEHEIATSRYLYGEDAGLAWHGWGELADGWSGSCATWDVTTYNRYAQASGLPAYNAATFDPLVGYDPRVGGEQPFPLATVGEYPALSGVTLEQHTIDQLAAFNIQPVDKVKVLNLPSLGYLPNDKAEGITLLPGGRMAVLNDNDFALAGSGLISLGIIDFDEPGNRLDASDRDNAINLQNWPVYGMFMPDGIASYQSSGHTYYVTANEGDDRGEVSRIRDLTLDPEVFPNAAELQANAALGRLNASTIDGDLDGDGDFDRLQILGARSFSVWDSYGNLVFDSSDAIAEITAALTPDLFNADKGDASGFDTRSDNKGAEPESVTVGEIDGRIYAFVALERSGGGVLVFDVTDPVATQFVQYVRIDSDIAPEGLKFISADASPNGVPLLVVSNEVSHTVTLYQIVDTVESVVVNDGSSQRSMVTEVQVSFASVVEIAGGAFQLWNRATSEYVALQVDATNQNGKTVARLSFLDGTSVVSRDIGNSLADGNYELLIDSAKVSSNGLQLTGEKSVAGDFRFGNQEADSFFRFFGDADGDRDVDTGDLLRFRHAFNTLAGEAGYQSYFDFLGDDDVDTVDLLHFRLRFNKYLNF